LNNRY